MAKSAILAIRIISDATKAAKDLGGLEEKTTRLSRASAVAGKMLAGGLGIAAAATVKFGKDLANAQRISAQTSAAIESTGGAAGVTTSHVEKLAGRLERMTATEAEAVQEGANLLLTFTNIQNKAGKGNKVFDRTTALMTDMSRAMGTDTKSSAMLLGKALNDPVKGLSALGRAGVQFTASQKKQIEAMVKAGDTMGAQKKILGELQKQFGGSGAAYAKSAAGQWELLQHRLGEIGESVVSTLMPAFLRLVDVGMQVLNFVDKNRAAVGALAGVLATLTAGVWVAGKAIAAWQTIVKVATAATKAWAVVQRVLNLVMRANPIGLIITAVGIVIGLLVLAYKRSSTFRAIVQAVGRAGMAAFGWIIDKAKALGSWIADVASRIWSKLSDAWSRVREAAADLVAAVRERLGNMRDRAVEIATAVKDKLSAGFEKAKDLGVKAFEALTAPIRTIIDLVRDLIDWIASINWPKPPEWLKSLSPASLIGGANGGATGALTAGLRTVNAGGASAAMGGQSGRPVQIVIQGAIDPEATARQIQQILGRRNVRLGVA